MGKMKVNWCNSCVHFVLILCTLRSTTEFSLSGMATRGCGWKTLHALYGHAKERVHSTADLEDRCVKIPIELKWVTLWWYKFEIITKVKPTVGVIYSSTELTPQVMNSRRQTNGVDYTLAI